MDYRRKMHLTSEDGSSLECYLHGGEGVANKVVDRFAEQFEADPTELFEKTRKGPGTMRSGYDGRWYSIRRPDKWTFIVESASSS